MDHQLACVWQSGLGQWVGTVRIGSNASAELAIEGDERGPSPKLEYLVRQVVPGQALRLALASLAGVEPFDDWHPDGIEFRVDSLDDRPELCLLLSSERDVYGLWEVVIRLQNGADLIVHRAARTQD